MSKTLDVYLDDNLVGKLIQDDSGALQFIYDDVYCDTSTDGVSISLPLKKRNYLRR